MRTIGLVLMAALMALSAHADSEAGAAPQIQIALLLDTSNSMDGLIDQAKAQLWSIVNEFVTAQYEGRRPEFEVALYQYGNNGLLAETGYIEQVLSLTDDLDKVSEKLFALTTHGGSEFCGAVIQRATGDLPWSENHDHLKVIFIAGNEPFTQGQVDFRAACKGAIEKGIMVNTIFCGPYEEGVSTQWKEGATLADGAYMNIDQDHQLVHINAPQDEAIERLGHALNETYVPYGALGAAGKANQQAQDSNATGLSAAVNVQRQATKATAFYKNAAWDLVDAVQEGAVQLEELSEQALPEELRSMNTEELHAYVDQKRQEREEIPEKINRLSAERRQYVAEEMKKQSQSDDNTLGNVIVKAVREQAEAKHFSFE